MDKPGFKLPHLPLTRWQNWREALHQRWHRLTGFQKFYLLALLALPLHGGTAALLAIAGLILDFWPRFVRLWESLAGKAAILLFYAVVANFAFASAAGLINQLTGVNADFLPYSLNTALLLNLPGYAFGISVLALVIIGLFFPLFLLAIFLLRLVGVSHQRLFRDIPYPVSTLCIRFVLSWLLIMQSADLFSQQEEPALEAARSERDINLVAVDTSGYERTISRLLSQFIYYFEAAEKSRCVLADGERAIELNDYQYLAISKDDVADYGLRYQVKACVSPGITLPQTGP
ncbi:hypothetical protein [Simiduia agarivorans]|uniref:Uncharacterized protein n=1 Tax=Simiduia agarivorans (strain DSM 21679 / JCM 13881 / BCRC 17597 / SA1) TaxID=1117647 RepID=K4KYX8_SIMAS|nr:hypothetical protein [Simiduia agarivorans]AFU99137.1 hypothetical protein M5M_09770 [Simiduia agarivorans SA1 = DSM 21679]